MIVYLVRHGEALAKDADPDRHLSPAGIKTVKKMAGFIKPLDLHLSAIWHSRKTRARETAEILSHAVTIEEGLVERCDLGPNDEIRPIARELRAMESDVMIAGHMPFMSLLTSYLLTGKESPEIAFFETAAIACLEQDSGHNWVLRWLLQPDLLQGH
jgi:phosphohistidine phosphatase